MVNSLSLAGGEPDLYVVDALDHSSIIMAHIVHCDRIGPSRHSIHNFTVRSCRPLPLLRIGKSWAVSQLCPGHAVDDPGTRARSRLQRHAAGGQRALHLGKVSESLVGLSRCLSLRRPGPGAGKAIESSHRPGPHLLGLLHI